MKPEDLKNIIVAYDCIAEGLRQELGVPQSEISIALPSGTTVTLVELRTMAAVATGHQAVSQS